MMPVHLFLLTMVHKVLKQEMTYEDSNKQKQIEEFYNESREKAFHYMNWM
ncbi:hypothetical protein [Pseudalkalibacillus sp. SCS-8]